MQAIHDPASPLDPQSPLGARPLRPALGPSSPSAMPSPATRSPYTTWPARCTVEAGPGPDVVAQATRGGADAAKLKVMKSEIDGTPSLRFVYPADRIIYNKLGNGSSTQLRVRDDGTFSDRHEDDEHRNEGRRVTISGGGSGLDAHADLRITVPMGKQLSVYLAVGKVSVSNVEGNLTIDAASAPVTTSNTRGDLDIDVGSGDVQVTKSRGDLSVDTGSGAVSLTDVTGRGCLG